MKISLKLSTQAIKICKKLNKTFEFVLLFFSFGWTNKLDILSHFRVEVRREGILFFENKAETNWLIEANKSSWAKFHR